MPIVLPAPNQIIPAKRTNPRILLFYAEPKVGKTELCLSLPDSLLIDINAEGSDFAAGTKITVKSLDELVEVGRQIIANDQPYKYLILDTAGDLMDWCEVDGTKRYKQSIIGKSFKGNSVLELPKGAGYYWLRISYGIYFECLASWPTECLIILAHVKDKMLTNKEGKEVEANDISLTGQLRQITCSRADAIGYLYRKDGKDINSVTREMNQEIWVSFRSGETIAGSRAKHLAGRSFKFSDVVDTRENKIVANWDMIFLKEEK